MLWIRKGLWRHEVFLEELFLSLRRLRPSNQGCRALRPS